MVWCLFLVAFAVVVMCVCVGCCAGGAWPGLAFVLLFCGLWFVVGGVCCLCFCCDAFAMSVVVLSGAWLGLAWLGFFFSFCTGFCGLWFFGTGFLVPDKS